MRMALTSVLVLAVLALPGDTTGQDKTRRYKVTELDGKDAPEFKPDFALNGDKANLESLKGKVVLVDFWAVWCGPCRAVFPELTSLHEKYGKQGLEVVGLTRYYGTTARRTDFKDKKVVKAAKPMDKEQEQEMLKKFVGHFKLPYRVQVVDNADFNSYKVEVIPTALLIDKKGKVRMVKVGGGKDAKLQEMIVKLLAE